MMSSIGEIQTVVKTTATHNQKPQLKHPNNNNSKRKNKHDRNGRKRSKSFSGCGLMVSHKPVLPTKFLLGGNINDPLNLNSLQDEEINRAMNAVTPKSSPIPTPPRRKGQIDVIIPTNMHDPLRLIDCADDAEYEQQLCSPIKKCRKKRLKKRRTISTTSECLDVDIMPTAAKTPENSSDSAKIPEIPAVVVPEVPVVVEPEPEKEKVVKDLSIELSPKKEKTKRKSEDHPHPAKKFKHSMNKIVSPVVPQPGAWLKRMNSCVRGLKPRQNKPNNEELPLFKDKDKQFQYGNYNRYYGYRNGNNEDRRLKVFNYHKNLFEGKDILDIGCNIGHVTLSIARDLNAKSITGIDIDQKLIGIARKNIKHYVVKGENSPRPEDNLVKSRKSSEFFPISMPILYGAIDIPGFGDETHRGRGFPNNVTFKQCNYVLEDDAQIALEQPQYDLILCLSITKWIHLNWGDAGIKQAFRRMYAQLRPGGKLILEPQGWSSYKGKKKLTPTIFKNYNSIEFFPDKFTEYLLSPAVGFAKSEIIGMPIHQSKGFRRPIQMFTKSTMFPSERVEATPINVTATPLYQNMFKTENSESQGGPSGVSIDHVYTDLYNRFCESKEDNKRINDEIGEKLNQLTSQEDESSTGKSSEEITKNGVSPKQSENSVVDNT